nr:hypothetical protein [Tanacetum cinerariifolium]
MTKSLANRLYREESVHVIYESRSGTYITYVIVPVLRKLCGDIVVWEGIHDNEGCSGDSEFKGIEEKTKGTEEETGDGLYVRGMSDHTEGHLKRDCPKKKSSGFDKKGKQDSDSSDDEGNTYFEEALVVVENNEMTELVMDSGGSYHMTHMRDFLYDFKVVDGGSVQLGYDDWDQKNCGYTLKAKVMTFGIQKHGGSKQVGLNQLGSKQVRFKQLGHKQVGFKQLGPGMETGVHRVQVEKRVWFEVELQGAQKNREAEVFQVSNDDATVAQIRLEDKQLEENTNTDCLVKEQKNVHLSIKVGANITVTGVPGQEGAASNVAEKKKVKESMKANIGKLLKYKTWLTRRSPVRGSNIGRR